jgi:hypothetical protein
MYIEVNIAADGALRLLDASNFGAFKIVVTEGHDADTVRDALAPVAQIVDDDHAMVDVAALMALAGDLGTSEVWREDLAGMLAYARSKGWVDDGAQPRVRAHIDWLS